MKFRLLLLIMFVCASVLHAQDDVPLHEQEVNHPAREFAYNQLIISEARLDAGHLPYVEITNVGDVTINLKDFELGNVDPWNDPYFPPQDRWLMLPDHELAPGESYVLAKVFDWHRHMNIVDPVEYGFITQKEMWHVADFHLHIAEAPGASLNNPAPNDSVMLGGNVLESWGGRGCYFIRHHFINPETGQKDSVVVDAVNGLFTGDNGRRPHAGPDNVAGVENGTETRILVRKTSVTQGNLDWLSARGIDIEDSEWLPIRILPGPYGGNNRKVFWTLGNHENITLNEQTVRSNTVDVDWDAKTMTVAWGARRNDSIMAEFEYQPGLAWWYELNSNPEDSAYVSVRTGDLLTLKAVGEDLNIMTFELTALPPTASEARVVPLNARGGDGGYYQPFQVTDGFQLDTIYSVPFAERVDTLFKYLEKAPAANWEIVWVDGVARPDLKDGDKLKVTSEDASTTKEYYVKVTEFRPNRNPELASITWPDIPEFYKGIFGWVGDTIPGFSPTRFNYEVEIPMDVTGVPAFVAKPENPNTKVVVERAKSFEGERADRTTKIHTTAEFGPGAEGRFERTYNIVLRQEQDPDHIQSFEAEPFFSQISMRENWGNGFVEVANPGTEPLDMSRYVIVRSNNDPVTAITESSGDDNWDNRFRRYVPGYIWADEDSWQLEPGILVEDLAINSIVDPGGVFAMGWLNANMDNGQPHPRHDNLNVNFHSDFNPWGYEFNDGQIVAHGWINETFHLYRIDNDSVLQGLKPLGDINDVTHLDVFGHGDGNDWGWVDGVETGQNSGFIRKPHIYRGNTVPGAAFGDGETGSEWAYTNIAYWAARGYGWPMDQVMSSDGIGSHQLDPITEYLSTVTSTAYIVSKGYSDDESISFIQTGTTVADFLANLNKADEGQVLKVYRNGNELGDADVIQDGDVLSVYSANQFFGEDIEVAEENQYTTLYALSTSDDGLDNNALLTSGVYTVTVNGNEGTIEGFDTDATIREVYDNVQAPATAHLFTQHFEDGAYAPFQKLNLDTAYVDVLVSDKVYFEVTAQDKTTKITYQLIPNSEDNDAYVLSSVYLVNQEIKEISYVPNNTSVVGLYSNLIPAPGASMVLKNNMEQEREIGNIYKDDILWVTARDGETQSQYSLFTINDLRATYLAFLFSDVYNVNRQTLRVTDVPEETSVADFLAGLYPSMGATIALFDEDGNEKTSGTVNTYDFVRVTSSDGSNVSDYEVTLRVSARIIDLANVKVYPNPTSGEVNITGISKGNTIRVFNALGHNVMNYESRGTEEMISLDNQPSGVYFVIVNSTSQQVAKFKLIKR